MLNNKSIRGIWWACAATGVLLTAGCVSAASEEPSGSVPVSDAGGNGSVGAGSGASGGSVPVSDAGGNGSVGAGSSVEGPGIFSVEKAGVYSEEELDALAEFRALKYARLDFLSEYSDEEVVALAFYARELLRDDPWGFDLNDLSTSLGALCWIFLNVGMIVPDAINIPLGFPPPLYGVYGVNANFRVWQLEREVEDRGLEVFWDGGPVDDILTLRRVLLTAREVRGVVFGSDLLPLLRPFAEELYAWVDDLGELPVVRVRPTLEELAGYSGPSYRWLEGITEEEIARIWPEEFEVELTEEVYGDYWKVLERWLVGDEDETERWFSDEGARGAEEVRGLLNTGCESRENDWRTGACPAWVADVLSSSDCPEPVDEPECPFSVGGCASEEDSGLDD